MKTRVGLHNPLIPVTPDPLLMTKLRELSQVEFAAAYKRYSKAKRAHKKRR